MSRNTFLILAAITVFVGGVGAQTPKPRPAPQRPAIRKAPEQPSKAIVVVETDLGCTLTVDGEGEGVLAVGATKKVPVASGEHIVRCVSVDDSELVWRKTIEVEGSETRAAAVELRPLRDAKRRQQDAAQEQARSAALVEEQRLAAQRRDEQDALEIQGLPQWLRSNSLVGDSTVTSNNNGIEITSVNNSQPLDVSISGCSLSIIFNVSNRIARWVDNGRVNQERSSGSSLACRTEVRVNLDRARISASRVGELPARSGQRAATVSPEYGVVLVESPEGYFSRGSCGGNDQVGRTEMIVPLRIPLTDVGKASEAALKLETLQRSCSRRN